MQVTQRKASKQDYADRSVVDTLIASFEKSSRFETPYRYWTLDSCITQEAVDQSLKLPFVAPDLGNISGKRELHNATRNYYDQGNIATFPVCASIAEAFQSPEVTGTIERVFGAPIKGCYLRIELAQDIDGFWLEPHTDLGVKKFTMLLYLSKDPSHYDLGTDVYDAEKKFVGRAPFKSNSAMIFVPSDITYHGFEKRPIKGVRTSLVINYVTNEWRAREQLAYPDAPIR